MYSGASHHVTTEQCSGVVAVVVAQSRARRSPLVRETIMAHGTKYQRHIPDCYHKAGGRDIVGGWNRPMAPDPNSAIEPQHARTAHPKNGNNPAMLFLTYWKINEGISARKTNEIASTLTQEGLFPPDGAEVIRWDATPDGWGIVLWEADEYGAVNTGLNMWRAAAGETAFFEETRTAPAAPVEEVIPEMTAMLEQLE